MGHEDDIALVDAALAGDETASIKIRSDEITGWLTAVLVKRGASQTEGHDLAADLIADCFGARDGKPPLLESYNGKGPLRGFLARAAVNRLIDLKRRQKFQGSLPERYLEGGPTDEFDLLAGDDDGRDADDSLVDLLRDSLIVAFSKCNPRDLMLMRLVAIHGVRQEAIADMFGWSQSKVSRAIGGVMEDIRQKTLEEMRKSDPWLELEWDDFVALCRSSSDFLVGAMG